MVDGGFDPLHQGHIAYFEQAQRLGLPVVCCLAPDYYVARKHPLLLTQPNRARIIGALRSIDYVYMNDTTTADALQKIKPKYYVKGNDWHGRLPEKETHLCMGLGIEIVFLDTLMDSSSKLIEAFIQNCKIHNS